MLNKLKNIKETVYKNLYEKFKMCYTKEVKTKKLKQGETKRNKSINARYSKLPF